MESVIKLSGTGIGKSCLIIGSGVSAGEFDYSKVPQTVYKIGINFLFIKTWIDFNLFVDKKYSYFLEKANIDDRIQLIGLKENISEKMKARVDYSFLMGEVGDGSHAGYFALKIADSIMKFDKIYLIGFDYTTIDGYIHYYGDHYKSEKRKEAYIDRNFQTFLNDFKHEKWNSEIYNLNKDSELKIFKYKERVE